MLVRPCPAEHIGSRGRRARGSWRSSPRRGLHDGGAYRSEDQVTLADVTEETEVRLSWKKAEGEVNKKAAHASNDVHRTFI